MRHRILRTSGQRIAWANSSRIPDDDVVRALRFVARHVDMDATVVHFKRHGDRRGTLGRAYARIPRIANTDGLRRSEWRYLVVVTDRGHQQRGGCPSWVETLAHEGKHVEQFRERLPIRERPANHFAHVVAVEWANA